jgi:hypothetical protein
MVHEYRAGRTIQEYTNDEQGHDERNKRVNNCGEDCFSRQQRTLERSFAMTKWLFYNEMIRPYYFFYLPWSQFLEDVKRGDITTSSAHSTT